MIALATDGESVPTGFQLETGQSLTRSGSTTVQPRSKGGAPRNNSNRLVHGRNSTRQRFSQWRGVSQHRPELVPIEADCERLLRQLEAAVVTAHGSMSVEDASAADVAVGALFVQRLALRRLTMPGAMPAADELAIAGSALRAMEVRHRFIKELRLPRVDETPAWMFPPEPDDAPESPPSDAVAEHDTTGPADA